jgi:hypothetical protein
LAGRSNPPAAAAVRRGITISSGWPGGFLNGKADMPIARGRDLLIALLITVICFVPSYGQSESKKTFAAVPIAQRARFAARLNLYVEHLLKNEPDKLLALYDEETVCSLCKGKPKCIEDCTPPMLVKMPEGYAAVLVEFKLKEIKPVKYGSSWDYSIEVDQKERVSWKGKPSHILKNRVRVYAVFQNADWFFSLVSVGALLKL